MLKRKALENIPEEKQNVMMVMYDATIMQRRVLQLADPNGQVGKSGQTPNIAADPGAKRSGRCSGPVAVNDMPGWELGN